MSELASGQQAIPPSLTLPLTPQRGDLSVHSVLRGGDQSLDQSRLVPGRKVYVYKKDWGTGRTVIKWPATVQSATLTEAVVRAVFQNGPAEIDGVLIEAGDIFTEHYYSDRNYNIFHIAAPDGQAKGWYCNVAMPAAFSRNTVSFVDLKLDVFVRPNGVACVLDEDEFAAACASCKPFDVTDVVPGARLAVEQLLELARRGDLPHPEVVHEP